MSDGCNIISARYPFFQMAVTYLLMPIVSLIGLGLGVLLLESESAFVGVLLILFGVWLLFLSVFGSLMCASIIVSDDGIASCNFGRSLKFVRWKNVSKIKKVRRWNAGFRSFEDVFYIFDGAFSPFQERMVNLIGPIAFTDKIRGLRNILDCINEAAKKYSIPLILLDQEAARKSAAQSGAGAWIRLVPKVEEIEITSL
nr:hypothetical protein DBT45_09350 [Aerococcus tenax]